MGQGGHYRDRLPRRVLFLDVECHLDAARHAAWSHSLTFRLACTAFCTYRNGREVGREVRTWHTPEDLWNYVLLRARAKPTLWVVAHNLGFDLTCADFWGLIGKGYGRVETFVIDDPPTVVTWRLGERHVRLVDFMNYVPVGLRHLGTDLGIPKLPRPDFGSPESEWVAYCKRDVEVLAAAWAELVKVAHPYGDRCWASTLPGFAWRVYNQHFRPVPVSRATDPVMRKVEREAYHPAECAAYYIGRFEGPVVKADVNSLYPWVMRHGMFPAKPQGSAWTCEVAELARRAADGPCVARVSLDSGATPYPVRHKGRETRATGKFWTALAGAELRHALTSGAVRAVREWAHYEGEPLFVGWVTEWYALRIRSRQDNAAFRSRVAKLVMNSLAGKWAQRKAEWTDVEGVAPLKPYGTWWDVNVATGERSCYRAVAGHVQKLGERGDGKDSRPAVAACITAAGRDAMRTLREAAGVGDCLYQDTDGIVMRGRAWDKLVAGGLTGETGLGRLRFEGTYDRAEIFGQKRYILGNHLVAAGVRPGSAADGSGPYESLEFQRLACLLAHEPDGSVGFKRRWLKLHPLPTEGPVAEDGRASPLHLSET